MKPIKLLLLIFSLNVSSCYKPVNKPLDFDKFWEHSVNELRKDMVYKIVKDTVINEKELKVIKLKSFQDIYIYLWVSTPLVNDKFPVYVRYSDFGRGNENIDNVPYKWFLSQKNNINVVVDIRGQGLSTDQIKFDGYLTKELFDKEKYIYRGAYLDAIKAVDFVALHPKGDGNIITMGGSQGGALAIVASALSDKTTVCVANFPFLTDMYNYDKTKWPMKIFLHETKRKELKIEDLHNTLSYFDILNFADKVNVPVFMRTQETDTVTPKEGSIKFFNMIQTENKNLFIDSCNGHGCSSKSKTADKMERVFIKNSLKN